VNKADGALEATARHAAADLRNAIHLLRPKRSGWEVPVLTCSAATGAGVAAVWEGLCGLHERLGPELGRLRERQNVAWMWSEVSDALLDEVRTDPAVRALVSTLQDSVAHGDTSPGTAATEILEAFLPPS
jgi:LAO/AO transport system kinase